MTRSTITTIAALACLSPALASCGATNTGNPADPGGHDAPAGVKLIRSSLERETAPAVSDAQLAQLGADSRDFALALYAQAASGESGNLFLSPYSISVALAMTYAGAEGETETEMASALRFTLPEPELHAAWNAVDLALEGRKDELASEESTGDGMTLEVTNALFAQTGFTPRQPFLDTLALHYDAGVYATDFAADPERARVAINDWTAERTRDRITDLLPEGSVDAALLVLVNAIYLKASWLDPFEPSATMAEPFHAPGGDVTVQMMHGPGGRYAAGDGYQAVELPYISPSVRMVMVVPDEGRFDEIEAGFDAAFFDGVQSELSDDYEVALGLPRFTIDGATVSLKEALEALGMRLAFTSGADLSGIVEDAFDVYVSDVLHQAFVAVDEQGTEAAAATAVIVSVTGAPPPKTPVTLTLDRPFLFAIYDQPTGQILFIGRLVKPS